MTDTHEQRVVEQRAQAIERRADGGLDQEELFRGAGDIAFLHQRLEHHHQVDVGLAQFVAIHAPLSPSRVTMDEPARRRGSDGAWCRTGFRAIAMEVSVCRLLGRQGRRP
ncbi:hypothetical protein FQZ97_1137860 [compost metagenome]